MTVSILIHESAFEDESDYKLVLGQCQNFKDKETHVCLVTDSDGSNIPTFKHEIRDAGYRFDNVFDSHLINGVVTFQAEPEKAEDELQHRYYQKGKQASPMQKYESRLNKAAKQLGKPLHKMILVNCNIPEMEAKKLQDNKGITVVQRDDKTSIDMFISNLQAAHETVLANAAEYKFV